MRLPPVFYATRNGEPLEARAPRSARSGIATVPSLGLVDMLTQSLDWLTATMSCLHAMRHFVGPREDLTERLAVAEEALADAPAVLRA